MWWGVSLKILFFLFGSSARSWKIDKYLLSKESKITQRCGCEFSAPSVPMVWCSPSACSVNLRFKNLTLNLDFILALCLFFHPWCIFHVLSALLSAHGVKNNISTLLHGLLSHSMKTLFMVIFLCELNTNTNTHAVAENWAAHMHHKTVFLRFVLSVVCVTT